MKKLYYTLAYLIVLGLPVLLIANKVRVNSKALIAVICASIIVGQIIEIWAVKHGKKDRRYVWSYGSTFILGPKIFDIPIEDFVLFLVITPVFIVYFYEFFKLII